jgi:hypothetical protein
MQKNKSDFFWKGDVSYSGLNMRHGAHSPVVLIKKNDPKAHFGFAH